MNPHRSMDRESKKDSRLTLPLSTSTTETASCQDVSPVASIDSAASEPNWPRNWRAYTCWLGCFFLMFNSWGLVNAYGTFASYYVGYSLRHVDQMELNLIGSTESGLVLLLSAVAGRLLDAGHYRYVVGTGTFLVPFGLFMLAVAHPKDINADGNYGSIWATHGLVVGLGMACFFVASSQIAATWFPNRKGLAVGFVACGASVAGVVYPAMLRFLIDALGFNKAVCAVAGLAAATAIYSFLFAVPNPAHTHPRPQSYRMLKTWLDTDAFNNKAFLAFTAAVAFLFFGFYPVFFNLEEWAAVSGFGTRGGTHANITNDSTSSAALQTFWLLAIMNGASTFGRLTMAAFSDRTGQLNMHIVAQIISSLLVFILWTLAGSTSAAIAFCVLFGIFSGTVIGLPPASVANILNCTYNTPETKHMAHAKLGQWTGMMYSFAAIPSLIGPLVAGHLVTQYSTYITVQMWSGANLMLSAFFMILARWYLPCYDGERFSTKIARLMGKHSEDFENEKGKGPDAGNASDSDAEFFQNGISQATTRVPSCMPSRTVSDEKIKNNY